MRFGNALVAKPSSRHPSVGSQTAFVGPSQNSPSMASPLRPLRAEKCNPCLRNVLLPMSPERTTYRDSNPKFDPLGAPNSYLHWTTGSDICGATRYLALGSCQTAAQKSLLRPALSRGVGRAAKRNVRAMAIDASAESFFPVCKPPGQERFLHTRMCLFTMTWINKDLP